MSIASAKTPHKQAPAALEALEALEAQEALEALRARGNPFRQQFARNADDAVCSRYHVEDLFATERETLARLVGAYVGQPERPTAVLPLLGPRGAGKTHLLHWLKHGPANEPRLFVTPGTFRADAGGRDSSFIEYLLYQLISVLLSADEQRGARPLAYVGERLTRRMLTQTIADLDAPARHDLVESGGLGRLLGPLDPRRRRAGKTLDRFVHQLENSSATASTTCRVVALEANLDPDRLTTAALEHLEQHDARDLKGTLRKRLLAGFIRATLLDDEADLADFLTDGFADAAVGPRPGRAQLTLSLLQALTELIVGTGIPVAVAFDQLEELLYGQTDEEVRRCSDAFFGGIVQLMSQVPGLAVLLFVEEGLWNRIVPPLPPHILDRIHEPIFLDDTEGLIRTVRLRTPSAAQLRAVVARRIGQTMADVDGCAALPDHFPFAPEFLDELARSESVLRLMLQGCCNRLDELLAAGPDGSGAGEPATSAVALARGSKPEGSPAEGATTEAVDLPDCWQREVRAASRRLEPVGSLSAATSELMGGLVRWLHVCKALGVEQGDWRLTDIVDETRIGDHPTYGTLTIVEWTNGQGERRRVGIGLWLGRGVGKPRDLRTKLQVFAGPEPIVDHLIVLRPADDVRLSGKTKAAYDEAIAAGHGVRIEAVALTILAKLFAFPRWMRQVDDTFPDGNVPEEIYVFLVGQTEPIMHQLGLPAAEDQREPNPTSGPAEAA